MDIKSRIAAFDKGGGNDLIKLAQQKQQAAAEKIESPVPVALPEPALLPPSKVPTIKVSKLLVATTPLTLRKSPGLARKASFSQHSLEKDPPILSSETMTCEEIVAPLVFETCVNDTKHPPQDAPKTPKNDNTKATDDSSKPTKPKAKKTAKKTKSKASPKASSSPKATKNPKISKSSKSTAKSSADSKVAKKTPEAPKPVDASVVTAAETPKPRQAKSEDSKSVKTPEASKAPKPVEPPESPKPSAKAAKTRAGSPFVKIPLPQAPPLTSKPPQESSGKLPVITMNDTPIDSPVSTTMKCPLSPSKFKTTTTTTTTSKPKLKVIPKPVPELAVSSSNNKPPLKLSAIPCLTSARAALRPVKPRNTMPAVANKTSVPPIAITKSPDSYTWEYFRDWQAKLESKLQDSLPQLNDAAFEASVVAVQSANVAKKDAEKVRDEIQKQKAPKEELDKANQAVQAATEALKQDLVTCQETAGVALKPLQTSLLSNDYDDSGLVTYVVLKQAGAKNLAAWCQKGDQQTNQLLRLLNNPGLMRTFLRAGGAKKGQYGRAMELYEQLQSNSSDPVLQRLSLAVALELCVDIALFGKPKQNVNPLHRYIHYEQAYLLGELDPAFSTFTTWEMRNVVNSDAPDDQLGWGRQSLMNYRPDLVVTDDPQWRYCRIVKTDVAYKQPEWYKPERTYDQILSGGGKCGPRAWYGRFACKAFGIPTWGVRQPGHAAMTRWTRKGWMTCLGAGFQYSWWEGRGGLDFQLETQARSALADDTAYMQQVMRLEWVAFLHNENNKSVADNCLPDPNNLWWAISLMQRKRLAAQDVQKPQYEQSFQQTKLDTMKNRKDGRELIIRELKTEKIVLPAACCSNTTKNTDKVTFLKSFLGGQQLFLSKDALVEYVITGDNLPRTCMKYKLTCRICTAHRNEEPVLLTVTSTPSSRYDPVTVVPIEMPYTMGLWEETKPVVVEIGGSRLKSTKLSFQRKTTNFGFSLKDIKLIPIV